MPQHIDLRNCPTEWLVAIKRMQTRPLWDASALFVRINGLEPLRLSPLDPKSSAATNYAISAWCSTTSDRKGFSVEIANIHLFFDIAKRICKCSKTNTSILRVVCRTNGPQTPFSYHTNISQRATTTQKSTMPPSLYRRGAIARS